jgi:ribosomal protein L15E
LRGLTATGKKSRGVFGKGNKSKKHKPSRRAASKRNNIISLRRYR